MKSFFYTLLFYFLVGCSGTDGTANKEFTHKTDDAVFTEVAGKLSGEDLVFFKKMMPDIAGACIGIIDKWHELEFVSVNRGDFRPTIVWHVPNNGTSFPGYWMASGHNCYFEYDAKQDAVMVSKAGCKNICSGKEGTAGSAEFLTVLLSR